MRAAMLSKDAAYLVQLVEVGKDDRISNFVTIMSTSFLTIRISKLTSEGRGM